MKRATLELTQPAWIMLSAVLVLVLVGLACIYVTDTHYIINHDGPRNAAKQLVRVAVSVIAGIIVLRIGYLELSRYSYLIFAGALLLLVPPLLARILGTDFGGLCAPRNGAYRWIHLPGFPLQPSEIMKIAFVIALAWYLRYRQNYRRFSGLMVPVIGSGLPLALILLEPDLGTVLLLVPVLFTMLFMAGAKISHLALIMLIGLAATPLAWGQIKGYQRARVTAVLLQSEDLRRAVIENPEEYKALATKRQAVEWAAASGYQLVHSKNAIGSGGVLGNGWGKGVYARSTLLPDRHNDFVFAIIGHQWGLVGCLLVLACFTIIVITGVAIASSTTEPFARLLAVGLTAMLVTQVLVNVGMTVGLLPITGTTLPFVSYGGSSLITNFIGLALLISISQRKPFLLALKPFEFGRRKERRTLAEQQAGLEESGAATTASRKAGAA